MRIRIHEDIWSRAIELNDYVLDRLPDGYDTDFVDGFYCIKYGDSVVASIEMDGKSFGSLKREADSALKGLV